MHVMYYFYITRENNVMLLIKWHHYILDFNYSMYLYERVYEIMLLQV